ncbi:oxidoreductase [Fulvitalea axinellae]|uniref:Oxidoreductase n=1 Tax=Fulvitalea axinellae TaxID=1182444 RepID=A0AAU9C8H4_9BACT|nr:oxidoreductase [Fulvitalea axinellae]
MAEKKVVWIVGASSGIGEALARKFAKPGYKLALSARRRERLQEMAEVLECETFCFRFDLESDDPAEAFANVKESFGRLDTVMIVAGLSQRSAFLDMSAEVFDRIMRLNFSAQVDLVRAVLPEMVKNGGGQFVVINSLQGHIALPERSAYSASKHASLAFFDSLRLEYKDRGVKVLNVCPAYVNTDFSLRALSGKGEEQTSKDKKHSSGVSPDFVANQISKALNSGEIEIFPGRFKDVIGIYLQRFLPKKLFQRLLSLR